MAEGVITLTVQDRQAVAALARIATAQAKIEEAATKSTVSVDAFDKVVARLTQDAQGLTAAERKLAQDQAVLDKALSDGAVSAEKYAAAMALLTQRREALAKKPVVVDKDAEAAKTAATAVGAFDKVVNRLAQDVVGLGGAERKLAQDQAVLEAAFKSGQVSAERYASAMELVKTRREAIAAKSAAPSRFQELTEAVKANSAALTQARGAINQGAEGLGKLASAATLVSPELSALLAGVQKIAGVASAGATGAELLGGALTGVGTAAAVGLAVAPLVPLWYEYAAAQEAATAAEEAHQRVLATQVGIREQVLAAQRRTLEALGGEAAETAKAARVQEQWAATVEAAVAPLRDEAEALAKEIELRGAASAAYEANSARLVELAAAIADVQRQAEGGLQADLAALEIAKEKADSDRVLTERSRAKAKAKQAEAEAERDLAKEQARTAQALGGLDKVAQAYREAQDPQLAYLRTLGEIREAEIAGGLAGEDAAVLRIKALEELEAVAKRAADAEAQAAEQAAARRAKADEEAARRAMEAQRQRVETQQAALSLTQEAITGTAALIGQAFGEEAAAARAAAIVELLVKQALVFGQAAAAGPIGGPAILGYGLPLIATAIGLIGQGVAAGKAAKEEGGTTYGDTPGGVPYNPRDRFAQNDIQVFAARSMAGIESQLSRLQGGGATSTTVELRVGGRTAERIRVTGDRSKRGRQPGTGRPPAGRRQ